MIKWDADDHPRWPAGAADSKGGEFAPKGEGGEGDASLPPRLDAVNGAHSYSFEPSAAGRSVRVQLADAGMSDVSDDPMAEAARAANAAPANYRVFESRDAFATLDDQGQTPDGRPKLILAAAEGEEDR